MRRLNLKTKLSLLVVLLGIAAIVYAQVTTTTSVGRLELLFPDYRHVDDPPGSLHAKMTDYIQKISDNMNGRYFTDSQTEGVTTTYRHNYGVPFDTQCIYLYSGTWPNFTLISNPSIEGWTIEANATNPNQEIDVTTPSTPGTYNYGIISTATACGGSGDVERLGTAKGSLSKYQLVKAEDDGGTKLSRLAEGTYGLVDDPSSFNGGGWPTDTYFGQGLRFHYTNTYTGYYAVAGANQNQLVQAGTNNLSQAASSVAQNTVVNSQYTNDRMRIWPIDDTQVCACMTDSSNDKIFFSKFTITSDTTFTVDLDSTSQEPFLTSAVDEFTCGYDPTSDQCVAGVARVDGTFAIVAFDYNTDSIKPAVDAGTITGADKVLDFFAAPDDGSYGFVVDTGISLTYVLANKGAGPGFTVILDETNSPPIACEANNGQTTTDGSSLFVTSCKSGTNMLYVAGNVTSNTVSTSATWTTYATSKTHYVTPQFEPFDKGFLLYSYSGNQYFYRLLSHDGNIGGSLGTETLLGTSSGGGSNFGIGSFPTSSPFTSQVVYYFGGFDQQLLIGQAIPSIDYTNAIGVVLEDATDGQIVKYALLGDTFTDSDLGSSLGPIYVSDFGLLTQSATGTQAGNVYDQDKIHIKSKVAPDAPAALSYFRNTSFNTTTNDIVVTDGLPVGQYLVTYGASNWRITYAAGTTERAFINMNTASGDIDYLNSQFAQVTCGFQFFDASSFNYWQHFGYSCTSPIQVKADGSQLRLNTQMQGSGNSIENFYMVLQPLSITHQDQ